MRQKNGHGFTFHQDRAIPHASTKLVKPAFLHWSAWTKPGRCAKGIDFVSFYVLLVGFGNYYNSVVFPSWFLPEHNNIDIMPRPTNPPELNHIEHILNKLNHPASRRQQKRSLYVISEKPSRRCMYIVMSVKRCLLSVIDINGWHSSYWNCANSLVLKTFKLFLMILHHCSLWYESLFESL